MKRQNVEINVPDAAPFVFHEIPGVAIEGHCVFHLGRKQKKVHGHPGRQVDDQVAGHITNQSGAQKSASALPSIVGVDFSYGAGFTAFNLWANLPAAGRVKLDSEQKSNIFGGPPLENIETRFQAGEGVTRANVFFQTGAAPLFPLANRLRSDRDGDLSGSIKAKVMGEEVTAPRNQPLCHLHGMTYDKVPDKVVVKATPEEIYAEAFFAPGFFEGEWTGQASLKVTHTLKQNTYAYHMHAVNTGLTPMPMGMGSHPYFKVPSRNYAVIKLRIPATQLVQIDNYKNVFPTGEITDVPAELDFDSAGGKEINGRYLDNLWVDLRPAASGFAFVDLIDTQACLKIRMTATTKNIIGLQAYCPEKSDTVALEFVTHLPDPREKLWRDTPTGMKLVPPGGEMSYGYSVEISHL